MKYDIKDIADKKRIESYENNKSKFNIKRFFSIFFIIFFVFFILVFYFIIFYEEITGEKFFYPKKIYIKGLTYISEDEFIYKFKLNERFIFNFFSNKLKEEIKSLYYIKDLKIRYKFLNNIIIEIKEKPNYIIVYDEMNGIFYYVSEDGFVLKKCVSIDLLNYIIVTIESYMPKIGEKIEMPIWISEISKKYNQLISQIKINKDKEIIVFINGVPFYAKGGNYLNKEKIENLILISKVIGEKLNIKFIDLSLGNVGRIIERND
jgi:cell division septal protein FtsQ